jgi:predicted metal-dependent peptidase
VRSEELGAIVVAVDTSGSIDPTALEQFSSEIGAIMEECRTTLSVFHCDSAIEGRQNYEPGEEVKLQAVGGGGTDFRPVFDAIEEEGMTPACLIYLTDLDGRFPDSEPWYPVLWACVNARRDDVPFGEKVRIE